MVQNFSAKVEKSAGIVTADDTDFRRLSSSALAAKAIKL